ncbi:MAG: glycosyltransferase [Bacteroidales bacterium]|nr:glycosyltransferase [Bacteroidales bacterium]
MLSICIPVYNYDVSELTIQIHKQCSILNVDFEILILEDGSQKEFVDNNTKTLSTQKHIKHIVNTQNSGRSVVRNQLAEAAKYDKILFLDCDSKLIDDKFILN